MHCVNSQLTSVGTKMTIGEVTRNIAMLLLIGDNVMYTVLLIQTLETNI